MATLLGVSAHFHDSAAALVRDGRIVAAAQEERFSRRKFDNRFPEEAIAYCLRQAGLKAGELDGVVFSEKPLLKFDRLMETVVAFAPWGWRSFASTIPKWLHTRLHVRRDLKRVVGRDFRGAVLFAEHHESHAASAFYPSPFDEAAILTIDGMGEWATGSIGIGRGRQIELLREMRYPHSVGLLYSAFTQYCGFKVDSGEYKLMGLAPYGDPEFCDLISRELVEIHDDGSVRLNLAYFDYCAGTRMISPRFETLFGGPARKPEEPLTERIMNIAASIQSMTETIVLRMARTARELTGSRNLCLAGGVALNCVANGKLHDSGLFDGLWIQPASGDAGGALGCALLGEHQILGNERRVQPGDSQSGSLLGPSWTQAEIEQRLTELGATYSVAADDDTLCEEVAGRLADGEIVAWFQGRMEFGPRALGARSILGDARRAEMQSTMNLKIKFRESFRPFAPAVLQSEVSRWFDVADHCISPYMMRVAKVRSWEPEHSRPAPGLQRLRQVRSQLPAVTHVDGTARFQTVDPERHGLFHQLLSAFHRRTGCPVVINTSFNVRGEPIVCSPDDAYRCFRATEIDWLAIGRCLLRRVDQPPLNRDQFLLTFEPD
jgi:carbamoyltransferase